jgi:hypothetical protein
MPAAQTSCSEFILLGFKVNNPGTNGQAGERECLASERALTPTGPDVILTSRRPPTGAAAIA